MKQIKKIKNNQIAFIENLEELQNIVGNNAVLNKYHYPVICYIYNGLLHIGETKEGVTFSDLKENIDNVNNIVKYEELEDF